MDQTDSPRSSALAWLVFSLGVVYATAVLVWFPKWTVDDAYITYRYAANLAHHGELTWNVGEDPIEGYTGLVLPVTLAGAIAAGLDPDATSKAIGVLAYFAGGLLLLMLQRRLGADAVVAAAVSVLYFVAPFMFTHAVSGLETTLFTTMVLADLLLLAVCLQATGGHTRNEAALSVALLATSLTRPEGVVLAGLSFAALGLATLRARRADLPRLARNVVVFFVAPAAAYFLWRYAYYGFPLPNTYYAKARSTFQGRSLLRLARFASEYLAVPFAAAAALVAARALPMLRGARERMRPLATSATVLVPAVIVGFVLVLAGQYAYSHLRMNYSYRFFVPVFPALLAIAGVLASAAYASLRSSGAGRAVRVAVALLLVAAVGYQASRGYAGLRPEINFAAYQEDVLDNEHVPAGKFLKEVVEPSEWLVVVIDAGAVPYFSELKTVDFGGINDEFLSKRHVTKPTKQVQSDYFFSRNPGAVVMTSYSADRVQTRRFKYILQDPRFQEYRLVRAFGNPGSTGYNQFVFLRRDIAEGHGLGNLDEIWTPDDVLER
jgi:arabinofuranosyltransferase